MTCRKRLVIVTLPAMVVAVAPLVTAGCGGTAGGRHVSSTLAGSSAPPAAPRSPLIVAADAICQQVNVKIAAAKPALATPTEIARLTPRNAALEQQALTELRRLRPPASLAHAWQHLLSDRQTLVSELRRLTGYARANDTSAIASLARSKRTLHHALLAVAARAGFRDCGRVG